MPGAWHSDGLACVLIDGYGMVGRSHVGAMVSTWVSCHGMHHDHSAHGHARTERFGALLNSRPSCELIVSHQASQVQQLAFQFLNSDRFGTMRGARPREREREGLQKGKVKEGERGMPREREREKS